MRQDSSRPPRTRGAEKRPAPTPPANGGEHFKQLVALSSAMLSGALQPAATVEDVIAPALALFKEIAASDVEIIMLRGDDDIVCKTSGVQPTLRNELILELLKGPFKEGMHPVPVSAVQEIFGTEVAQQNSVRAWHCLPLVDAEKLHGLAYLGIANARSFSEDQTDMLNASAERFVTALRFHSRRAALEQAVRARDQMLSVVAHDLRNPLNVIGIAANTLLQRFADTSVRSPIDRILRSAHRADRMIRDLLEIDSIETGRLALERMVVEPADIILAALDSQQALAAEASVIIGTDLSPQLPRIEADEEHLHRVLENLIGNAIKFTHAGGHITVGATARDGDLLCWVKDSGIGIAPEHLPHIFDRFYQASRSDRHGTGLGLTICKGIVDAHKGRLWAESTPGKGTTMFFALPATPGESKHSPSVRANILLVDDRPENLVALEAILARPDYRLVTATSGEEALSISLREHFAVALIDVAMPGMNGLDVAVNLKALERSRDIPIIFITAFGNDPEEIHRAYTAGGADYLVKPLDAEIVRKKVAVFVELSRRRSSATRASART
jgi:signal transduction histidine kinase/ActR/RegA family two-component response regulator